MSDDLLRLKIELSELLNEIAWEIPDEEFYRVFSDTIEFLGDYY